MASSYNTIGLELMATGENAGTWGSKTNSNLDLIQQAIAGYEAVTITDSATTALVMSQAAISNARNMVIKIASITLTGATTVTIPNGIEKFYIFDCSAITGPTNLTIKTASGTGFTLDQAKIYAAYSDGTNLNEISLDTLGGTVAAANISGTIATAQIADNAITTAKISALQVTADKIANSTITAAKLATNSVGPDQLISTGVTAGSYTVASITVDADGRITAASSGSAAAQQYILTGGAAYPGTFTFTAQPTTTKINILACGGGGGGGQHPNPNYQNNGGHGGLGWYSFNITAPYSRTFTVGAGGSGDHPSYDGQPGGSTTWGNPAEFTVTGGSGGTNPGSYGSSASGTAPGSYLDLSATTSPSPAEMSDNIDTYNKQLTVLRNISGFNKPPTGQSPGVLFRGGGVSPTKPAGYGGTGAIFVWENILT